MKLGVLFSGGKDSTLALEKAAEKEQVTCLITVLSKNPESYMYHTPNIHVTTLQAEAIGLPLITRVTEGKKEEELKDLEQAITEAINQHDIEGVVTGAVESVYQAERVQRICNRLDVWCFNPLWKRNQKEHLEEIVAKGYQVIISGIFAYPLDRTWLGRQINKDVIEDLVRLEKQFGISPSGEGGEIETTVLDAPMFKEKIEIMASEVDAKDNSGVLRIKQARLVPK